MRALKVLCNLCESEIEVTQPDDAEVAIQFDDLSGRIDLCADCRMAWRDSVSALLVDALPFKKPKPVAGGSTRKVLKPDFVEDAQPFPFVCGYRDCKAAFASQRGLSRHKNARGH